VKEPIRKITHKDGRTRYRLVVDIGFDADGKRKQLTRTFGTKKEALAELSRIRHQVQQGTFVAPRAMTVDELLDVWIASATRDVEEGTASNYDSAIRPVREHLGDKKIQNLTEEDVERLIDWMLTSGRRRGGQPGTGLGIRSVRLTLGRLRSALNLAVRRQWVVRNVAEHVTISREAKRKAEAQRARNTPWNETEVKSFLTAIRHDRLYAAMMLALIANRPAEVCGARWEDVDLDGAGTIAIDNTRTIVYDRSRAKGERNRVVEKGTKTEAGKPHPSAPRPCPQVAASLPHAAGAGDACRRRRLRPQRLHPGRRTGTPLEDGQAAPGGVQAHESGERPQGPPVRRPPRLPVLDGQQRRPRHRRVSMGRPLGPELHQADLRAPRPREPAHRIEEAQEAARLTKISSVCERL
jgi:integrase